MMTSPARHIPLDRRVCVVREDRIHLRPERAAVVLPLIGLAIGLALFASVALFADSLSTTLLAIMLLAGLIFAPLSAMGVIYSIIGAAVVVERKKQSVRFQQGVLGLGLGTIELVPFWKIERIEVDDFPLGDAPSHLPRPAFDLRAWDIVLVKTSGKRLSIAQAVSANQDDLLDEGFNRALDAAEAIGAMTDKPVVITAAVEEERQLEAETGEDTTATADDAVPRDDAGDPASPLSRARERACPEWKAGAGGGHEGGRR